MRKKHINLCTTTSMNVCTSPSISLVNYFVKSRQISTLTMVFTSLEHFYWGLQNLS
jgi:hypothetical protein